MSLTIRPIHPDDDKQLAVVIRSILEEHGVNRPGTVYTDPTTDHLSLIFDTPKSAYWVAELDEKIVGGCGIFPTPGLAEDCVELVKLYVLRSARGNKIGSQLINKSIDSAREFGFNKIYLESMPELTTAVSLYENLGFELINQRLGESGHFACDIWMSKNLY